MEQDFIIDDVLPVGEKPVENSNATEEQAEESASVSEEAAETAAEVANEAECAATCEADAKEPEPVCDGTEVQDADGCGCECGNGTDGCGQAAEMLSAKIDALNGTLGQLSEALTAQTARLEALESKFDKKIAEDAHKAMLFDKMYDELATYKKDMYAKLMSPFVNEAISLLDDYERMVERIETIEPEKIVRYMRGIPGDIEDMLENNGVERFEDETGRFNPKTQRVLKTLPTTDRDADNTIAERVRRGYRWNGIMLKPEMVKIYKYKEEA